METRLSAMHSAAALKNNDPDFWLIKSAPIKADENVQSCPGKSILRWEEEGRP